MLLDATMHVFATSVIVVAADGSGVVIRVTAALPARVRVACQIFARTRRCGFGLLLARSSFGRAARSFRCVATGCSRARVLLVFAGLQARGQRFVGLGGVITRQARRGRRRVLST